MYLNATFLKSQVFWNILEPICSWGSMKFHEVPCSSPHRLPTWITLAHFTKDQVAVLFLTANLSFAVKSPKCFGLHWFVDTVASLWVLKVSPWSPLFTTDVLFCLARGQNMRKRRARRNAGIPQLLRIELVFEKSLDRSWLSRIVDFHRRWKTQRCFSADSTTGRLAHTPQWPPWKARDCGHGLLVGLSECML